MGKSQGDGLFLLRSNRTQDKIENLHVEKPQVAIRKYGRLCLDVKLNSVLLTYIYLRNF